MKEIDFIPEWYKANQNRRKRYHRQYVLLVLLLVVMMGWSFFVGEYVEQVRADVETIQSIYDKGSLKVQEGMQLEEEIAMLKHQAALIEAAAPRTDISPILAELSWQIRGNIVLSGLSFKSEVIQEAKESSGLPAGIVRIGGSKRANESMAYMTPMRMCITLTGIAEQGADAALLISRLEGSDYFDHVSPVYTKAAKVKDCDVTEFEIRCYLADYRLEKQE